MIIKGTTQIYGVIGRPVSHTLSPALHNAVFAELGMDAVYIPMHVEPENVGSAIAGLTALGFKGINVTVPHKRAVMESLDEIHDDAKIVGAVNTISNRGGTLHGYNTDAEGFLASLRREGIDPRGKEIAVIGAGGAARAVVHALCKSRAAGISILNRSAGNAEKLAGDFAGAGIPISCRGLSDSGIDTVLKSCIIIVNTTPLGMKKGDPPPVAPESFGTGHTLIDLIYNPWETSFLSAGLRRGAKTLNGYGMLVYQAAAAFEIWTGIKPPPEIMWKAGLGNLPTCSFQEKSS